MRISRLSGLIVIVSLLVVSFVTFGQQTPSCTIFVQPGESIQEAIDKVPGGAVICLSEGTWEENLTISKSLTLQGAGDDKTIIKGTEEGYPVVSIGGIPKSTWVKIASLKITGAKGDCVDLICSVCPHGVLIQGSAQATITDCIVSENGVFGVMLEDSAQVAIINTVISGNEWGIGLQNSSQATITHSTVVENRQSGMWLTGSAQAMMAESKILWNAGDGVEIEGFSGFVFWNGFALFTERGQCQVQLKASTISDNTGDGIRLIGTASGYINGCEISGNNQDGVHVVRSELLTLVNADGSEDVIWDAPQISVLVSKILENRGSGIVVEGDSWAILEGNMIQKNKGYGVALCTRPCFDTGDMFEGYVTGHGNKIPGPGEPNGNRKGAVCPDELDFLMTDQGGEFDQRK